MPHRVGLASELERRAVGHRRIGRELGREQEGVDLKRVGRGARGHRRVEPAADVQNLARGSVPREQTVGGPRAPIAAGAAGREVLLVREEWVTGEEVAGPHGCRLVPVRGSIVRIML